MWGGRERRAGMVGWTAEEGRDGGAQGLGGGEMRKRLGEREKIVLLKSWFPITKYLLISIY